MYICLRLNPAIHYLCCLWILTSPYCFPPAYEQGWLRQLWCFKFIAPQLDHKMFASSYSRKAWKPMYTSTTVNAVDIYWWNFVICYIYPLMRILLGLNYLISRVFLNLALTVQYNVGPVWAYGISIAWSFDKLRRRHKRYFLWYSAVSLRRVNFLQIAHNDKWEDDSTSGYC